MRIKTGINHLLDNLDIRTDENWAEEDGPRRQLEELAKADGGAIFDSDQLNITQPGDKSRILLVGFLGFPDGSPKWQQKEKMLQEKLTATAGIEGVQKISACFLVKKLEERAALEEYFDSEKRMKLRNATGHKKVSLVCEYLLIGEYCEHVERLTDIEHYEVINHPPLDRHINIESGKVDSSNVPPVRALIFTLKLYNLAELYNRVGESLFRDNVRFGIQEVMGVDQAIQATLKEKPEDFWFKNNGITILVKGDLDIFSGTTELTLGVVRPEDPLPFSVVNGAQTICAAARFFFQNKYRATYKEDADAEKRFEKAKDKALVFVRVICVSENDGMANQLMQEIGVALNRQKPIKAEDIAFTATAVQKLVEFARSIDRRDADGSQIFQLIRRGEVPDGNRHYLDLVSFARARMACVGDPHVARSKGANMLLKVQTKENDLACFVQDSLFPDEWNSTDDSKLSELFHRDYNAVWFAHQMAKDYESIQQNWTEPEDGKQDHVDQWVALQNGKWYCVAAMVYLLNRGDTHDFTGFLAKSEDYHAKLKEIAECIADLTVFALRKSDSTAIISSNTFKRQDIHIELTKVLTGITQCSKTAKMRLDRLSALMDVALPLQTPDLKTEVDVGSFVVLDKKRLSVKSDVEAFRAITEYVLAHYPAPDDLSPVDTWFTRDQAKVQEGKSCFRSAFPVSLEKISGWVGTSSSANDKRRQLDCLCQLFGVKENTLTWHRQTAKGWFWTAPAQEEKG